MDPRYDVALWVQRNRDMMSELSWRFNRVLTDYQADPSNRQRAEHFAELVKQLVDDLGRGRRQQGAAPPPPTEAAPAQAMPVFQPSKLCSMEPCELTVATCNLLNQRYYMQFAKCKSNLVPFGQRSQILLQCLKELAASVDIFAFQEFSAPVMGDILRNALVLQGFEFLFWGTSCPIAYKCGKMDPVPSSSHSTPLFHVQGGYTDKCLNSVIFRLKGNGAEVLIRNVHLPWENSAVGLQQQLRVLRQETNHDFPAIALGDFNTSSTAVIAEVLAPAVWHDALESFNTSMGPQGNIHKIDYVFFKALGTLAQLQRLNSETVPQQNDLHILVPHADIPPPLAPHFSDHAVGLAQFCVLPL